MDCFDYSDYGCFMIVVVYLSFVSIDIIDVNLLCLWVP